MRDNRGTLTEPGTNSPFRDRTRRGEPGRCFRDMRDGKFTDGATCCAPRSTWPRPTSTCATRPSTASSTPSTTAPATSGASTRCTTYAHPIEDALENITHSLCTLEFEDQRPFYDWLLERLADGGLLQQPLPQQNEFARLNLTYVVTSKRKLHAAGGGRPRAAAGTTRACRPSSACAGAATRRRASSCSASASA